MGIKHRYSFLVFFLVLNACAAQTQVEADFYEGLKRRHSGAAAETTAESTISAAASFEKALLSINASVASAAAAELMDLHAGGLELSAETMTLIRYRAAGSWAVAFEAIGESGINREKALSLLLHGENRLPNAAARYVLGEWRGDQAAGSASIDPPSDAENAVIDGCIAAANFRYREALTFFRAAVQNSPVLFFRYPDLLTDLGRSFQYAASGREGLDLFLEWERGLNGRTLAAAAVSPENERLIRFRLLFFAARIARQQGLPDIVLFERALTAAHALPSVRFPGTQSPDVQSAEIQSDACIWYILDSALAREPDTVMRHLAALIPQWHDDAYFADVMDKLARELVLKRQWDNVLSVLALLRNRSGIPTVQPSVSPSAVPLAQYAWIIARALAEDLLTAEDMDRAATLAGGASGKTELVKAYTQMAYNGGTAALYYRSLSAAVLDEPFLDLPETIAQNDSEKNLSETMQFLLGFFANDTAHFAPRYIREMEGRLSPNELRRLAAALESTGQYRESIRLVSGYTGRDQFRPERRDLELLYPRPFREPVERYAAEAGLEPALLYGLIRTESAFDPDIVSRSGAVGLTQLMPATAAEFAARIRRRDGTDYTREEDHLRDPAANIHIGAVYLAYLNERMADPLLALLAYNGGMSRVRRWRIAADNASSSGKLPVDLFLETVEYPETRNYGRKVMAAAAMYRELYYHTVTEPISLRNPMPSKLIAASP